MKKIEPIFDILYLVSGAIMGIVMLARSAANPIWVIAGMTALTLIAGDSFHLLPRTAAALTGQPEKYQRAMGRGKQITSISMTVFYLLLWHTVTTYVPETGNSIVTIALYILAAVRIILCLNPNNRWTDAELPVKWGIYRNIPFFIMGLTVIAVCFINRDILGIFGNLWLAVLLSFAFYAPVTLWVQKNKMLGMLMLPKTCMYIWVLTMLVRMGI